MLIITCPFWEWSSSVLQQISFHLSDTELRDTPTQTGEIFMDICGTGVIFLSRSYFWGNHPQFSVRGKNPKFYDGPMDTFCFISLILRTSGHNNRFSLTQVLVFWGTLSNFLQGMGQKTSIPAKFSSTFGIGGFLLQTWQKYGKSKTVGFITDYLTIFTPNL